MIATTEKTSSVNEKIAKKDVQPESKKESNQTNDVSDNTILLIILAFFIPFLAVYLYEGEITTNFWINLLLCLLFGFFISTGFFYGWGVPIAHAILVILDII